MLLGEADGLLLGELLGDKDGLLLGLMLGEELGLILGEELGLVLGEVLGLEVGLGVGLELVGLEVTTIASVPAVSSLSASTDVGAKVNLGSSGSR